MRANLSNRDVQFRVQDGCLVRTTSGGDGRIYTHRCARQTFETVAHVVAETPADGAGASLCDIARQERLPYTQVNVALEFFKGLGIVEVRHRRCYPATPDTYLDAMVEFCALAEEAEPV